MSTLLEHALAYGTFGWAVLPLHSCEAGGCGCGDPECGSHGKHPRTPRGVKDATRDEGIIRSWWRCFPDANVGIATGFASGLLVLDIDPRHGGDNELADLEREFGRLPTTPVALTGGGGQHLIFARPKTGVWGNAVGLRPGIDVRGDGGYIVAPPSTHASGNAYQWDLGFLPRQTVLTQPPPWLCDLLQRSETAPKARAPQDWRELVRNPIVEGGRNQRLTELTGHLLRRWIDPHVTLELIHSLNLARCRPPLTDDEVYQLVNSIAGIEQRRRAGRQ